MNDIISKKKNTEKSKKNFVKDNKTHTWIILKNLMNHRQRIKDLLLKLLNTVYARCLQN